jgi:hypothetical protein
MIDSKYGIEIIDNVHYYNTSLCVRLYNLERSTPYKLTIGKTKLVATSWGRLVEKLADFIISNFEPKLQDMLDITLDWTKQPLFISTSSLQAHMGPLSNEIYVNANHTSTHLLWIIQDLLRLYKIDLNQCKLLIRRPPGNEEHDVREYFFNNAKLKLQEYIVTNYNKSIESSKQVINNLLSIDKKFNQLYPTYHSLLLFESKQDFALIKSRFLAKLKKTNIKENTYNRVKSILDMLTKYYGITYPKIVNK